MTVTRRVAHVQGPSWAHPWLEDVVTRLLALGWAPLVIGLEREGELQRAMRARGVPSLALDSGGRRLLPRAAFRLARTLRDVDIVHAHLFEAELAATLAGLIAARPVVITRHASPGLLDLLPIGAVKRAFYRGLDRMVVRRAAAVIAPSALVRAEVLALGARPSRVHTVLLGVDVTRAATADPDRAAEVRRELAPAAGFVALTATRLSPEKRVDAVLRAWPDLLATRSDASLLVAGDGSERGRLEALARELGIAHAVAFLGWRTDLATVMAAADLVVHASATESTGLVLLEALASATPLVTTPVGVAHEYLVSGVHCLIVPHADSRALAAGVLEVARDPAAAASRARAGREVLVRRSAIEPMVHAYADIYEEVAAGRSRRAI